MPQVLTQDSWESERSRLSLSARSLSLKFQLSLQAKLVAATLRDDKEDEDEVEDEIKMADICLEIMMMKVFQVYFRWC